MQEPDEKKQEKAQPKEAPEQLSIDARLLSEAIIELNISRRSIGLYPPSHPIIREAIDKAFALLNKLFELRSTITLGIAKDTLVIDDFTLDSENPVFMEFALSLHSIGIAALTFVQGAQKGEIVALHQLLTMSDPPQGQAMVDFLEKAGVSHIKVNPIDYSTFRFIDGARTLDGEGDAKEEGKGEGKGKGPGGGGGGSGAGIWDDYVHGLLEGRLLTGTGPGGGGRGSLIKADPAEVARVVEKNMSPGDSNEKYDRVITDYLQKKSGKRLKKESFEKFSSFVDNLSPQMKNQFLSRTFATVTKDISDVEKMLANLDQKEFEKTVRLFTENSSMIPDTLKNMIDKLSSTKKNKDFNFDMMFKNTAVVHDIELDQDVMDLFKEDHFNDYVKEDYKQHLDTMMKEAIEGDSTGFENIGAECREDIIDQVVSQVIVEVIDTDVVGREEYLGLLTKLTELIDSFVETGRFEEVLDVYNTLYSHALSDRFKLEASSMLDYYLRSELFVSRLIDSFRIWGRQDRVPVLRLARAMKFYLIDPMLEALSEEQNTATRRFFISVLRELGSDVVPDAVRRLADKRWYVVRNMLLLITECGGQGYLEHARKYVKHQHPKIASEALKSLIRFRTRDAIPHLRTFLANKNVDLRDQGVRVAGLFRIKEAIPILIEMLSKRDLLGSESYYRISVVRSLGLIGDPRALGPLTELYKSKALFNKANVLELRIEIIRSLGNYPFQAAEPLLQLGLASKNEIIQGMSEKLHSAKAAEAGEEGGKNREGGKNGS